MIRVFCCFIFLICHIFVVAQPLLNIDENKMQVEHVQYYHLGTFNAIVGVPVGRGPFPIIVYSYDEFYEWSGKDLADRIGYNLEEIAQFFAKRGYLCVIFLLKYIRYAPKIVVLATTNANNNFSGNGFAVYLQFNLCKWRERSRLSTNF